MYKSLCLPSSGTGSCKKRGQDLIDNNKRVKVLHFVYRYILAC